MDSKRLNTGFTDPSGSVATADLKEFVEHLTRERPLSTRRRLEDYLVSKKLEKELDADDDWFDD